MSVKVSSFSSIVILLCCLLQIGQGQTPLVKPKLDSIPPYDLLQGKFICWVAGVPIEVQGIQDFNQGNLVDAWQLVLGRIPGVSITRPGGDPNGEFVIRIRGTNTLTSDWRPLIVVDGVAGISLQNIDPNNIETIQVLKEAASAAIYGMRAANGVVIITTKRGVEGAPAVTAFASLTIDRIGKTHQTFGPQEFVSAGGIDYGSQTDWIDEVTQTALTESMGFAVRQRLGNTSYSASVNYRDIEGIIGASSRRRLNTAFRLTQSAINDRLTLSFNLVSTNEGRDGIDPLMIRYANLYNPTAPVFDDVNTVQDGGYFQEASAFNFTLNPVALSRERFLREEQKRLLFSGGFGFQITPFLKVSGQYSEDRLNSLNGEYYSRYDNNLGTSLQGAARRRADDRYVQLGDLSLSLDKDLSNDVRLMAGLGMGFQSTDAQGFVAASTRYLFDSQTFNNLGAGSNRESSFASSDSYRTVDRLNSYYGSVAVSYKQNLNAYFNWRADTYSAFVNQKTGFFYGMGLRYDLTSLIDAGIGNSISLRLSHGLTGNLPPDPTLALAAYVEAGIQDLDLDPSTTDDRFRNIAQAWNSNPELTWEKVQETNIGLDFSMETLRINGSVDYFSRKSTDLIFSEFVPVGAPNVFSQGEFFTSNQVFSNFMDLSSAGVELSLNYQNNAGRSIKWQSQVNAVFYQQPTIDRMSSPAGNTPELLSGFGFLSPTNGTNFVTQQRLGGEVGSIHTPRYLGSNNGQPLLDGVPFEEWEKAGSSLPTADLGIYNTITKGQWQVSALLRGSFGHSLLNVTRMIHENTPSSRPLLNIVTSDLDENLNATVISDLYVEDASFLRLNHLTISRRFPLSPKSSLEASLTGQNLFTITGYQGIDPEVRYLDANNNSERFQALASGVASRELYFTTRTWTLAIKVNF